MEASYGVCLLRGGYEGDLLYEVRVDSTGLEAAGGEGECLVGLISAGSDTEAKATLAHGRQSTYVGTYTRAVQSGVQTMSSHFHG